MGPIYELQNRQVVGLVFDICDTTQSLCVLHVHVLMILLPEVMGCPDPVALLVLITWLGFIIELEHKERKTVRRESASPATSSASWVFLGEAP